MPGLGTDPTLGTGTVVGKYFGLVSTIPAAVLATWIYILIASGAVSGPPDLDTLLANGPIDHPQYLLAVSLLALALALIGHPIQFALVQILEGYWGSSRLARGVRAHLVLRQLDRRARAARLMEQSGALFDGSSAVGNQGISGILGPTALERNRRRALLAVTAQNMADTASFTSREFPSNPAHTMPTRFGNVLRRHEQLAGAAVDLPVLEWATHIGMAADPAHNDYLNDQRTQMDLSVRMTAYMALATALTFALLWPYGAWCLITLVPFGAAWISYVGATVLADAYGSALQAWVDLNRLRMYDLLGLAHAPNVQQERERNDALHAMRLGQRTFDVVLEAGAADSKVGRPKRVWATVATLTAAGASAALGIRAMAQRRDSSRRDRIPTAGGH